MNKRQKTLILLGAIAILALTLMACSDPGSDDWQDDVPRFGDGMKIGEKLEKTTCEAQGGNWSDKHNRCY